MRTRTLAAASALVGALRKSGYAREYLSTHDNKQQLILPALTRWVYNFYVLDCLLDLEIHIQHICCHVVDNVGELTGNQWKKVKEMRDLLQPFKVIIRELEGDEYMTISQVIPALARLFLSLNGLIGSLPTLGLLAQRLKNAVVCQMQHVLNPQDPNYKVLYSVALLLDPKFSAVLNLPPYQQLKPPAKAYLDNRMAAEQATATNGADANLLQEPVNADPYAALLQAARNSAPSATMQQQREEELRHFEQTIKDAKFEDSFAFWNAKKAEFPLLYKVAVDMLATPATTAPVERVFSQAGLCTGPRSRRVTNENLEHEVLIRVNEHLLQL